jgi:hypothetical protein
VGVQMDFKNRVFTPSIIILLVAVGLTIASLPVHAVNGSCVSGPPVTIDVFTQKAPFDGRGANESSDMFGPQETVVLYAMVLLKSVPAPGELVTFEITGPAGRDIKFFLVALTNASGVAETQFTFQIINQTDAFGIWTVIASVEVDGGTFSDTLTFNVGWIIELVSIKTLGENPSNNQSFGKSGYVGVEIALKNNARIEKNATLEITILDVADVPIDVVEISNFTVPPNGKVWYIFVKLYIKSYALVGPATVVAVALNDNGTAYSPQISTTFLITILNPISPNFVDTTVYLGYLPLRVAPGQLVTIPVVARNQGTTTLSGVNTTLYINGSLIASEFIDSLDPYAYKAFYVTWNTTGLPDGNYSVTANVSSFPNETELSDNSYTTTVELITPPQMPICVHDIQVSNVICSKNEVYQGETVEIRVEVRNNGNFTESTTVEAYYDGNLIQEENLTALAPATERIMLFQWDTTNVPTGTYQISATANPVEGETHVEDNSYIDGTVKILSRGQPSAMALPYWVIIPVLVLFGILAGLAFLMLVLICFSRRRRRKTRRTPRFVIISHPHI